MDHAEAQALLEVAAVEPGGLERLMAGDTAEAAALAGHLAGCSTCTAEVGRLGRDAALIRETVRAMPPDGLRERTLAYVAALGRGREPAAAPATEPPPSPGTMPTSPGASAAAASGARPRSPVRTPGAWIAALAAAVVIAVGGTALVVNQQRDAEVARLAADLSSRAGMVASLERVATAGLQVAAEPDAEHVALRAPDGGTASGGLIFSPTTRELVVLATGLTEPPDGRELRCWVEVDGRRQPVGRMFFADDVAFWAGPVEAVADLPPGATFGVTDVDASGSALDGPATLSGDL